MVCFQVDYIYLFEGSFACVIRHRDLNETDLKILATVQDRVVVKLGVQSLHLGSVRDAVTSLLFLPQFVVHMSTTTLVVGSYAQLCIIATPQVHESIKVCLFLHEGIEAGELYSTNSRIREALKKN